MSQSIARFTSFSLASTTFSSVGSVVVCQACVVVCVLAGFSTRYAINAVTRERSRDGLDANNVSMSSRCIAVRTARTGPSVLDAVTVNASDGATSVSPFKIRRNIRACSIEIACVKFAIVRLRIRPSSRLVSRSRMAGRDVRFGTMSTCMAYPSIGSKQLRI